MERFGVPSTSVANFSSVTRACFVRLVMSCSCVAGGTGATGLPPCRSAQHPHLNTARGSVSSAALATRLTRAVGETRSAEPRRRRAADGRSARRNRAYAWSFLRGTRQYPPNRWDPLFHAIGVAHGLATFSSRELADSFLFVCADALRDT
jgi:hypothetical protein